MEEKLHVDVFILRISWVRPLSVVFQVVFLRIRERVGVADLWTGRSNMTDEWSSTHLSISADPCPYSFGPNYP